MRIISGKLKSRLFDAPKSYSTHPMGDRVRGGLYSVLGDIEGLTVLDAFAGSGALSLEAISRGATKAVAIEIDKKAYLTLSKNIQNLGLVDFIEAIRANINSWANNNPNQRFDIVLCDPPYTNLQIKLLENLARHANIGGIVVYSLPPDTSVLLPGTEYRHLTTKSYGDAQLVFYRKTA